ncbi:MULTISPECIES: NfeD family protein [unclassified Phaeobacter]|uniref:NfeD family protein n=1 Tax=unclassified Phaeobacter TaxID=2621772 RepID=UPI003A860762
MTALLSVWWVWIAIAIGLAIVEVLAPGFIFLGFAVGAVLVALLLVATPAGSITLPVLLLVYATLSLIAWLVLRHFFKGPKGQVKHFDHDIND